VNIFRKVLASGVNLIQHGATGPAVQIHLSLRKNVLYWSGGRPVNGRRELPVPDVMFIDIGKNTAGFVSGHSAKHVDQELCFSLVTSDQVKLNYHDSLDVKYSHFIFLLIAVFIGADCTVNKLRTSTLKLFHSKESNPFFPVSTLVSSFCSFDCNYPSEFTISLKFLSPLS
jgi:hypothetical protein